MSFTWDGFPERRPTFEQLASALTDLQKPAADAVDHPYHVLEAPTEDSPSYAQKFPAATLQPLEAVNPLATIVPSPLRQSFSSSVADYEIPVKNTDPDLKPVKGCAEYEIPVTKTDFNHPPVIPNSSYKVEVLTRM